MPQYDNNMTGVLFKNTRSRGENSPEYTGSCEINREEYWVSAWVKEGKKGKFFSLAFRAKNEQQQQKPQQNQDFDDSIPF